MAATQLRNLDLNLLLALDALLTERNVTRAAERLGLSQPTVSAALGRVDSKIPRTAARRRLSRRLAVKRAQAANEFCLH
jgi:regulatory helix-turn-helix LysR family protein